MTLSNSKSDSSDEMTQPIVDLSALGQFGQTIEPQALEGAPDPDTRYLTTVEPGYAVLALSLGNEGIMECAPGVTRRCTATKDEADRIYEQFFRSAPGKSSNSLRFHIQLWE